jgi:Trypsin
MWKGIPMTTKRNKLSLLLAALVLVVSSSSVRVQAITNGFPDTTNTFSNVGTVVAVGTDGQAFQICSGTLISPTVFLGVAHCALYFSDFLAPEGFKLYMSFRNPVPIAELTDVNTLIPVPQFIPNPKYVQANATHPFSPHHNSDPGDLAVIILPLSVTQGITPAALPTLGLLDELAAKNALRGVLFTDVGYGSEDRFGNRPNPMPRMFAFSAFRALEPGFLQLSINPNLNNGGACFGDSGGPDFLPVTGKLILMAVSSVGGDHVCRATSGNYRLDTATARDFLKNFVTLQ